MEYQISRYSNLIVELQIPSPETEQPPQNPLPIEQIGLVFTFRNKRSCFDVAEDGERTLVWQWQDLRIPLCDHQFPAGIFNRGGDSLFRRLAWSFDRFEQEIDAEIVADALIERWIQIRDEANSRSSSRVFAMTVDLILWSVEARHEIRPDGMSVAAGETGMVPACGGAVTEMLRRIEIEEQARNCVICLEGLRKKGEFGLQMPCLHVFHGRCIREWLKNSHYCPICRFQMPTQI